MFFMYIWYSLTQNSLNISPRFMNVVGFSHNIRRANLEPANQCRSLTGKIFPISASDVSTLEGYHTNKVLGPWGIL